jgi:hypothetical protein
MATTVLLSGGHAHPFAETSAALAALAGDATVVTDVDAAVAALPDARLLLVNALWWSMTQDEKYAPFRAEHARDLDPAAFDAIAAFVAGGGALFAFHTATICWDRTPGWKALMGGGWTWGRSHHPPLGPVLAELTPAGARLSDGPPRFFLLDECYHDLDPAADCTILATATAGEDPQPVAWHRRHGAGRVAVDALGHDRASIEEPGHAALIAGILRWLGDSDAGD